MNTEAHESLVLNGREILFRDVVEKTVSGHNEYEVSALQFISDWLNEVENFNVRTSGSTGEPKDITITREQMIQSARATQIALSLKPEYTALVCLDVKTIAGKMMVVRSLVTGMKMIIVDPAANPFVKKLPSIDFIALVPYQVETILHSIQHEIFNSIKTVLIGGAPVKPSLASELQNYQSEFYLSYGMTETISHIALANLKSGDPNETPVFKALPGINLTQDDRDCLVIEAPYLQKKVVTNDIVKIFSKIFFHWNGRFDNVINTGGVKVQPEKIEFQIEKIFKSLNFDQRFFISGIPSEKTGEMVALFIEGSMNDETLQKLEKRLKNDLDRFHQPRKITVLPTFIYTDSGKLDRRNTVKSGRF